MKIVSFKNKYWNVATDLRFPESFAESMKRCECGRVRFVPAKNKPLPFMPKSLQKKVSLLLHSTLPSRDIAEASRAFSKTPGTSPSGSICTLTSALIYLFGIRCWFSDLRNRRNRLPCRTHRTPSR